MKHLILLLLPLLSGGCVYTSYETKEAKLKRLSVGGNQTVGKVDLKNGVMEGYVSEQAQVAGAVVEAAVRGAVRP